MVEETPVHAGAPECDGGGSSMTAVQQPGTRSNGKSVGSAVLGVLLTLAIFVLTFVGFLIAPLALLLVAFLVWTVMRPRQGSAHDAGTGPADEDHPRAAGFGAGAR